LKILWSNIFWTTIISKYSYQTRLKLILKPDYDIVHRQNTEEFQRLKNVKDALTDEAKIKIIKDSVELSKHQNQLQDPNVLPCISVEDIPKEIEKVEFNVYKLAHGKFRLI
jgi:Zn-dependent M16 (insulinase) family peptidase